MRSARWGEIEEARPRLEEALRRGARDAETWHALGLVRLHLNDYDGAAQAYRSGAEADPKDAECWLGLASVGIVQGDARLRSRRTIRCWHAPRDLRPRSSDERGPSPQLGRRDEAERATRRAEELGAPRAQLSSQQRAALAAPRRDRTPATIAAAIADWYQP